MPSGLDPWRPRGATDEPHLPPGPVGLPLLGQIHEVWRDPLTMFMQASRRFGDTFTLRFGPYRFVALHRPEDIRHVYVKNADNYVKSPTYRGLERVLGKGLVTSEGEFWRRQRKLANPAFHRKRLAGFADAMVRCTEQLCDDWTNDAVGRELDVAEAMMGLTFRIVGHTLFSTELGGATDRVGQAMTVANDYANKLGESLVSLPAWTPTPDNVRFWRAKSTLDELVIGMIEARRREMETTGVAGHDLMAMLMEATDETGAERMSDEQLRDEVLTLVAAGHETTANALSWTFMLLSQHPDVARRLRAELDAVLGDRSPTIDDLPQLSFTEWVVKESMRLYPPVWIIERQALGTDEIGPWSYGPGTVVATCMYAAHRNPELWPNPEGFDPDRFSPERSEGRPRYAYMPFGAGPRSCIGNHFAMMEAVLVVATLAQRFELELEPGHRVRLDPGVTLRPAGGLPMRVRARCPGGAVKRAA